MLDAVIDTGEVVREVPVVVVEDGETAMSGELVGRVDATPDVRVVARTGNMGEAREMLRRAEVYGIIRVPENFSREVNRGGQAHVSLYCDMSGLLYYKALLLSCTEVSLDMGAEVQVHRLGNTTARQDEVSTSPLASEDVALFNPASGFASFLIPAVLMLVIQQTLLLGIGMITGPARELG